MLQKLQTLSKKFEDKVNRITVHDSVFTAKCVKSNTVEPRLSGGLLTGVQINSGW